MRIEYVQTVCHISHSRNKHAHRLENVISKELR